ncbi:hypothetical protein BCR39DRAFT_519164 [Naematelia encephala]|uniref:Cytidyltransferase-like domain-containing protein n=1 Tax=Naematelia encephala TaxID=71784 RepID=A0A1Y2BGQ8_9TREE|nr:hypothetical protein BCR39DRAFT_519164 [Naematelia encephala]
MSSTGTIYPSAKRHTVLVLPFTTYVFTNPTILLPVIFATLAHSSYDSLTVVFSSPPEPAQLYSLLKADAVTHWEAFQEFLGKVYATLAAAQWRSGRVLMNVEVHFDGEEGDWKEKLPPKNADSQTVILEGFSDLPINPEIKALLPGITSKIPHRAFPSLAPIIPSHDPGLPVIALGGTFDHLHAAHKLLLHLALFLTTRRLIVGIMSDSLLASKSNAKLVQPLSVRMDSVKRFLSRCGMGNVEMDVVEIHDPLGPTGWEKDIQGLVVSGETRSGGEMVNLTRQERGLGELQVFVVDVIASQTVDQQDQEDDLEVEKEDDDEGEITVRPRDRSESVMTLDLRSEVDEKRLKDLKLGSTAIRQWIADRGSHGDDSMTI